MRGSRLFIALGALCLATLVAAESEPRGSRSCQKWSKERNLAEGDKQMNKVPVLISKSWFLGYLSGRAGEGKRSFLGDIDDESVFLWLDNYCRDHPQEDLARAGMALQRELSVGQGKAAPR